MQQTALHIWLVEALEGEAGVTHRWCPKEDTLPNLLLVIKKTVRAKFSAGPQVVTEHYATGWKRELACENTVGYATDLQRSRELPDAHVNDAGDWANGLELSAEKHAQGVSLFPIQDVKRIRPTLIQSNRFSACPLAPIASRIHYQKVFR